MSKMTEKLIEIGFEESEASDFISGDSLRAEPTESKPDLMYDLKILRNKISNYWDRKEENKIDDDDIDALDYAIKLLREVL